MKHRITLTVAVTVLALSACGSPQASPESVRATTSAAASSTAAGSTPGAADASLCNDPSCAPNDGLFPVDGKYEFAYPEGATGSFEFESKPDPELESLRKIAKADPVHYMTVKVDNRKGSADAWVYHVLAYDAAGKKYDYAGVGGVVSAWQDKVGMDDVDLYNRYVNAINKYVGGVDVSEVSTQTLAFEGDFPDDGFTRVEVQPSDYGEGVDAYLEGQEPPSADESVPEYATVDECMADLARINEEAGGGDRESFMNDPDLKSACEAMVGGGGEQGN